MGYGGGSSGAAEARQQNAEREARIRHGEAAIDSEFAGFNPAFYDARRQNYLEYATPEFSAQLDDTRNTIAAGLARNGLLNSSAAVKAQSSLNRYAGQKTREISDQASASANDLRRSVEQNRAQLMGQLTASADPNSIASSLAASTAGFRTPSTFAPLGQFFGDFTQAWRANQVARANNADVSPMFSFGTPQTNSSMRIVG